MIGLIAALAMSQPLPARMVPEAEVIIDPCHPTQDVQGVAYDTGAWYVATPGRLCRYDAAWGLTEALDVALPAANHLGAIDAAQGSVWGAWLNSPANGRSFVTRHDGETLAIVEQWELTAHGVTYIDPIAVTHDPMGSGRIDVLVGDPTRVWQFALVGGEMLPTGVRWVADAGMGMPQGLRADGHVLWVAGHSGPVVALDMRANPPTVLEQWDGVGGSLHPQGFEWTESGLVHVEHRNRVRLYEMPGWRCVE